jgi:hypothetical protein
MKLAPFLDDLFADGKVTVAGKVAPFEEADLQQAGIVLKKFYDNQIIEMPFSPPAFSTEAALWSATYFYHCIQFAMLRDLPPEKINETLLPYTGEITPETIFSADLTFRYLPDLLNVTKSLAPDDILVQHIKQIALQWPFSSVGMNLTEENFENIKTEKILENSSLKYAYLDKIIETHDIKRVNTNEMQELVSEISGNHSEILWPDFKITPQAQLE